MKLTKELPIIAIVALPFIYLAYIWSSLPEKVPVHWNAEGVIDRYGSKTELLLIAGLMPLFTYLIFLVIPKIDPKQKIQNMGKKLQTIKLLIVTFMSVLAIFILYSSKNESLSNPNYILMLVGLLFVVLGNYFKTIKTNYFIGIRTPWTLESESVWKSTHKLAGIMWFIGGLLIIFLGLILDSKINLIVFLTITGIITIVPIIYSYKLFKAEKLAKSN